MPRSKLFALLSFFFCASLSAFATVSLPEAASGARIVSLADGAWSGSSVNMIANLDNSLFTDGNFQYAAFYDAGSRLILARRKLGCDTWETRDSGRTGDVADAHRTVAIVVDGAGYLHVSWNHHGSPLHYARSVAPGSLEIGPDEPMTGKSENVVTYPMFFRLGDGNLLFFYRDGYSGQGNVVLKRYDTASRKWTLLHDNLIDGEGARNAYINAAIDPAGTLHVAWTWRETPDVVTNHDLCYAQSKDGGLTWTDSAGKVFGLPVTQATAEYAAKIPQNSSLMNPPSVGAGWKGDPVIVNYWTDDDSGIPQWHIVRLCDGKWRTERIPVRSRPFTLGGTATKRPPISRAAVLVESHWDRADTVHIVYRDDEYGENAVVLSLDNIEKKDWKSRVLTKKGLDAWEPSFDPIQWSLLGQLQMLVQKVHQPDGNDSAHSSDPTPVGLLVWSPSVAKWMETSAMVIPPVDRQTLSCPLKKNAVLSLMEKCADWQFAHPSSYSARGWERAPFFIGVMALSRISSSSRFHDALLEIFKSNEWKPGDRPRDADDHCVMQAYLEMWRLHHNPAMIEPSRAVMNEILADPPKSSLFFGTNGARDRWSWCDSLFMDPAAWAAMSRATGDRRYLDYMDCQWWAAVDWLFQPVDGLFLRDNRFRDLRENNGEKIYWSRGNGWVVAGLCRVIDLLPKDYPTRSRYVALYKSMMKTVLDAQQPDGLWRPSLLDPTVHAARETSGSAFMTYALAWGVNRSLLDREQTMPAIARAWNALAGCVESDGRLTCVQPIGDAPQGFDPEHTEPFGVGAFLLAGSEIWKLSGE